MRSRRISDANDCVDKGCVTSSFYIQFQLQEGASASTLPNIEVLSEGQQFKIASAAADIHRGAYLCTATNKVGSADLGFDVDVITKPTMSQAIEDTIEVIRGESANIQCPVVDKKFRGDITWMKDFRPIPDQPKFIISNGGRKLHLIKYVVF